MTWFMVWANQRCILIQTRIPPVLWAEFQRRVSHWGGHCFNLFFTRLLLLPMLIQACLAMSPGSLRSIKPIAWKWMFWPCNLTNVTVPQYTDDCIVVVTVTYQHNIEAQSHIDLIEFLELLENTWLRQRVHFRKFFICFLEFAPNFSGDFNRMMMKSTVASTETVACATAWCCWWRHHYPHRL